MHRACECKYKYGFKQRGRKKVATYLLKAPGTLGINEQAFFAGGSTATRANIVTLKKKEKDRETDKKLWEITGWLLLFFTWKKGMLEPRLQACLQLLWRWDLFFAKP